jgi:dipeptidyl aminopeptidase/acylaminoacyl peptidase
VDLGKGLGRELARFSFQPNHWQDWDISPDASRVALLSGGENDNLIRILTLADGSARDMLAKGWSGLYNLNWSADGKALYASSRGVRVDTILYIDLNGRAKVLRQQVGGSATWAVPSPDGRHLAFVSSTSANNAWTIEHFDHARGVE